MHCPELKQILDEEFSIQETAVVLAALVDRAENRQVELNQFADAVLVLKQMIKLTQMHSTSSHSKTQEIKM